MTNETTKNFWKVMSEFKWPDLKPVFFRLYYSEDGTPIAYSMEELPHAYIEVDSEIYHQHNMNVRVVNGQLIFKRSSLIVNKLQPADYGTSCDPKDVCVVVSAEQPNRKWAIVDNEFD